MPYEGWPLFIGCGFIRRTAYVGLSTLDLMMPLTMIDDNRFNNSEVNIEVLVIERIRMWCEGTEIFGIYHLYGKINILVLYTLSLLL